MRGLQTPRRAVIAAAVLLVVAGVESTWPRALSLAGARPDLLILLSLAAGLQGGSWAGAGIGFAAGVVGGALGAVSIAVQVAVCVATGFVGGLMGERLHVDRVFAPMAGALIFTLAAWPAHSLLAGQALPAVGQLAGRAACNCVLAPVFFLVARGFVAGRLR